MGLSEEKAATASQLKRVHTLEHELEKHECRLSVERVARTELEVEVTQKEQQ